MGPRGETGGPLYHFKSGRLMRSRSVVAGCRLANRSVTKRPVRELRWDVCVGTLVRAMVGPFFDKTGLGQLPEGPLPTLYGQTGAVIGYSSTRIGNARMPRSRA